MLAGLRLTLERAKHEIVAETTGGGELSRLARKTRPDVVVLDVRLSGGPPRFEHLAALAKLKPRPFLLILGGEGEEHQAALALQHGGDAYLPKTTHPDELPTLLRQAYEGTIRLVPPETPLAHLNERDRALLEAIAHGVSNRDLAHQLGLGESAVKYHISKLFHKLNVRNRAEAAATYRSTTNT